ncbi:MAG: hypothetical protein HYR66_03705 [Sphingobacteriales bacterium]|nr:hypothetical protein [Sphingobacteriales bacterium]MBI3717625.1 hypothetical protein [Sphingobacteriales bacterium]
MTYKVKLVSQTNAIVLIIILLIIFIGSVFLFIPHGIQNNGLLIFILVILMTIVYFLWQRFVTGRCEWTINDDGITIVWIKKFAFANTKNLHFKWSEIQKINRGLDPNYYNLKIKLVSGRTLTFFHDYLVTKDGFSNMTTELFQTLNKKNDLSQK